MNTITRLACCSFFMLTASTVGAQALDATNAAQHAGQQEYWAHIDEQDWSAALATAQTLLATARGDAQDMPRLVNALVMVGNAQLHGADFAAAEKNFAEALSLAEQRDGPASRHTLEPLRGLGFTLAALNRHQDAIPVLDRALIISHRTHGLFHIGQQSILRQLTSSLTLTGQPFVAERHINYMLKVGERAYGENDPRMISLLSSAGDWHTEIGNFQDARRLYRDAIRLAEKSLDKNDVRIVEPLRRLASSFVYELAFRANGFLDPHEAEEMEDSIGFSIPKARNPRFIDIEGQRALQRALQVLESNPAAPTQLLIDTLVDAGDWFQTKHDFKRALPYYQRAGVTYQQHAGERAAPGTQALRDPLAFPVRVYYPVPTTIVRGHRIPPAESQEVFVQMEFTVTADGQVKDAKILESNTPSPRAAEVLNAIRFARFRPKLVNGEPVETTAMGFREVFRARKRSQETDTDDANTQS